MNKLVNFLLLLAVRAVVVLGEFVFGVMVREGEVMVLEEALNRVAIAARKPYN